MPQWIDAIINTHCTLRVISRPDQGVKTSNHSEIIIITPAWLNFIIIKELFYLAIWAVSQENLTFHTNSKCADQPVHLCSLISVFVIHSLEIKLKTCFMENFHRGFKIFLACIPLVLSPHSALSGFLCQTTLKTVGTALMEWYVYCQSKYSCGFIYKFTKTCRSN